MIGGVDVLGGSERTMVDAGFGGATGANDVASARIAQRTNFRTMGIDRVLALGELLWSALLWVSFSSSAQLHYAGS